MLNISIIRKEKGLSQSDLAKELGVTQSAVAIWEAGEAMPRADKLLQIAKILGCTVDELLSEEKKRYAN